MRDELENSDPTAESVEPGGSAAHDSDTGMQGRIVSDTPVGTTPSHERPSFRDPVPDNMDPTSPGSPEQVG
jgi:hypothetical protein